MLLFDAQIESLVDHNKTHMGLVCVLSIAQSMNEI